MSAGVQIYVNATLTLSDGQIETTALEIDDQGTLTGHGTVTASAGFVINGTITAGKPLNLIGDIDNAGTITVASGGHLRCFGKLLSDSGTIELQSNGVATVEDVQAPQTIAFSGPSARLERRSPGAFSGTIDGFAQTHTIELDAEATGFTVTGGGGTTMVTLSGPSGTVARLQMNGSCTTASFTLTQLPHGRSEIVHA
ncbi:hypothetical protein [Paraburkholderia sp. BL10I2N1]|uniref:hypothetical protein n=1 Tax=Paraburkholderia sp. BL10I2N1 TaxID=1938796 RepID=UPI0010E4323F|nr:hypothetical protein [Paraburkholderia sp. BL10I2N1]TDN63235.1 hypothetical protein B0G77_6875 [Paraburkholderia sp. BL10I2N1]